MQHLFVQVFIVAMLVIGCTGYAGWKLMPSVWRRALATALLKLPLPDLLSAVCRRAATAPSGCGCDGCDHAPKPATTVAARAPTAQPITFYPRARH